jgi:hypothetical protein
MVSKFAFKWVNLYRYVAEHLPHKRVDPWLQRLADVRDVVGGLCTI